MPRSNIKLTRTLSAVAQPIILLGALLVPTAILAQTRPTPPARITAHAPLANEKDLAQTQSQLLKLLRESPVLTTVVAHDPSLLANQDYVQKTNPQLAQFLISHPEIPLNPDYYLFTRLPNDGDGQREQALERAVWPELVPPSHPRPLMEALLDQVGPFLVFISCCGLLLWMVRVYVENRRWNRIFKLQQDVHSKLIDKFGTSQELLTYMETDAGRRFLEAAPLPVNFEADSRIPSAVARVLTPLQIGIVLTLLGVGLLVIRRAHRDMEIPLLVFGTMILMPGLGFIISAGASWLLAGRLGLMPNPSARNLTTFDPRERQ